MQPADYRTFTKDLLGNFGGGFSYLPDYELFTSHGSDDSAGGWTLSGLAGHRATWRQAKSAETAGGAAPGGLEASEKGRNCWPRGIGRPGTEGRGRRRWGQRPRGTGWPGGKRKTAKTLAAGSRRTAKQAFFGKSAGCQVEAAAPEG